MKNMSKIICFVDESGDHNLDIAKMNQLIAETPFYIVSCTIRKDKLIDKNENQSGNQLVDLIVSPIGRRIIDKPPKPSGNEIEYQSHKKAPTSAVG